MLNYLLTSFFFHAGIMLALLYTVPVNTSSSERIEVNIVQAHKFHQQPPILSTSPKYAKHGDGGGKAKKLEKVDLTDYGNRLKSIVDPVWVGHIRPYQAHIIHKYEIIVLLSVDKHGNIYRIHLKKSSGDTFFDDLAIQTFREIGSVPIPPESVIKDGIEWSLTF